LDFYSSEFLHYNNDSKLLYSIGNSIPVASHLFYSSGFFYSVLLFHSIRNAKLSQ
jgi:hypothetical protein